MKIIWQIEPQDIEKVRAFYDSLKDSLFVQKRMEKNVEKSMLKVTKDDFFKTMVSCLLTTQQRSGPNSSVTKFINTKPFLLNYKICVTQPDLQNFIQEVISNFGGLRRQNKIADEITTNLNLLERNLWSKVFEKIDELKLIASIQKEREVADFINDNFKGFGPKQARNLLQSLGLTKYEIPIDSRITKWLNQFGFPIALSATALADENYYAFVSDGIQQLCRKVNVYPCVLDAAIFASFDGDGWDEAEIIW